MLVSDVIALARISLATPAGASVRWNDTQLTLLIDRGVKATVAAIYFPESRVTLSTLQNQQEYPIPEMHRVDRVYMNGQPIDRTPGNVDTLEGIQTLQYDQSGRGAQTPGSGGPAGGTVQQPQWNVQTPVAYPFINAWGNPAPNAQPWFGGQRPRYYTRGGSIGIVPAPASTGVTLTIDCVRVPTTLVSTGQTVVVPDNFMDAITNYVLYRAFGSDKDPSAQQLSRGYLGDYTADIRKLRVWKRQYSGDDEQMLAMTNRGAYRFGNNRVGSGNS